MAILIGIGAALVTGDWMCLVWGVVAHITLNFLFDMFFGIPS